ncbi:MAG TPA: hemolysin [Lachnospiraceae bacterium]|nr:hemolysin [Lachnospiraceae bacterium]
MTAITKPKNFFKEPGSAITHLIGILLSVAGSVPILYKASSGGSVLPVVASGIFISSMALLYLASTLYHSVYASGTVTCVLQKFDHIMIYFLIAGTYTPVCLLALPENPGIPLLVLIWSLAACGLILTIFWINSPRWLNSTVYILMGWLCLFTFKPLLASISFAAFAWLFAGGVIYTIGGIIYALKLPVFNRIHKNFGSHEIFHLFVLGGSICHYYMIYAYLL